MNTNLFEIAAKNKYRFNSAKGINSVTVEDLFDLPLKAGGDLDNIAKALQKELSEFGNDQSFIKHSNISAATETVQNKFDIVKYVIEVRTQERNDQQLAEQTLQSNNRIREIIARKKEDQLQNMPIEELEKLLKK